tara:strand:+ start:2286 stop:3863 length:1578 start_codon:yes stop_codon:yes gene_type:complete
MQKNYPKSALLTTSAKTSLLIGGGSQPTINILGLNSIRIADLAQVGIKKAKAAVGQVYTIGGDTPTLVVGEVYKIALKRIASKSNSNLNDYNKTYKITLIDQTSDALNRQYVYAQLAAQLNQDNWNNITAVATAGTDLVLTEDAAMYFSGVHNSQVSGRGANDLKVTRDSFGGFADASLVQTVAPIYAVGIGADMQKMGAGQGVYGNLVSEAIAGKAALAGAATGQTYNVFTFTSVVSHNSLPGGVSAWNTITQEVFVDNGEGTVTTNLAGYEAFEREVERFIYGTIWGQAPGTIAAFFEADAVKLNSVGGLPLGAAGTINLYSWEDATLEQSIIGTQVVLYSLVNTGGLLLEQSTTTGQGMEFHPNVGVKSPSLVTIGSGSYSVRARVNIGTVADAADIHFGFKSNAAVTTMVLYDDVIAINVNAGNVEMITEDANSGVRGVTDTLVDWLDTETHDLEIRINADGTTEFLIDDVDYSNLIVAPVTHTAGQTLVPFFRTLTVDGGFTPDIEVQKFFYINDILPRD